MKKTKEVLQQIKNVNEKLFRNSPEKESILRNFQTSYALIMYAIALDLSSGKCKQRDVYKLGEHLSSECIH